MTQLEPQLKSDAAGVSKSTLTSVRLLGEAKVFSKGAWQHFAQDKPHALLAYLAYQQDWVSREQLADVFWSDTVNASARRNLRKILFKIRALTWFDDFEEDNPGLRWFTQNDVRDFQEAFANKQWKNALEAYNGPLLDKFEIKGSPAFAEWLALERMRLEESYQEARANYAQELEDKGDFDKALALIQETLKKDPLDEASHRSVMRLEHKRGNSEAVFEQFEYLRDTLKRELGVEPLEATVAFLKELEQGGANQGRYALLITNPNAIPDKPEQLLGRDRLLEKAQAHLANKERVLIQGFGGMGKTAFAATLANQHLKRSPNKILWLQVGSETPESNFDALAYPFDAQQEMAQAEDKASFLSTLLKQHNVTLVVLDDVWNAYSLSRISEALPSDLSLIVTSRQRYPRLKRLSLGRLERPASLELLSLYANLSLEDNSYADVLCDLLGDHAFVIRIAGLTLRESGLKPNDLITQVKNAPHDLQIPTDFAEDGRRSVASLLNASLETLEDLEYETFLTYGALYTASATPELLARCLRREPETVEEALFTLTQRGLAERITQAGSDLVSYRVHDLAHSYARVNKIQRPRTLISAGLELLKVHKDNVEVLETEIGNLLGAAQKAKDLGKNKELLDYMYLLTVKGSYFTARGHNNRSLNLLQDAINAAKKLEDLDKAQYLLGKLGDTYQNFMAKFELALSCYFEGLELAKTLANTSRAAIFLGLIGQLKSRLKEDDAQDYLEEAYELAKTSGDDLCLCIVLDQMGYVAGINGETQKANRLIKENLSVIAQLEKTKSIEEAEIERSKFIALFNLGDTELKLGRIEEALVIRKQALVIAEQQNNEMWMAHVLAELGEMHDSLQARQQAQTHLTKALSLFTKNEAHADEKELRKIIQEKGYETLEERLGNA